MRYLKAVAAPKAARRRIRLSLSDLERSALVLAHMRAENGALVLAEGCENRYTVDRKYYAAVGTGDRIFLFSKDDTASLETTRHFVVPSVTESADYVLESGVRIYYLISNDCLYYIENDLSYKYAKKPGGTSLAVHKDRVFFAANDGYVYWTFLFPDRGFKTTGTQESGGISLTDLALGNVVRLISFGDVLYLFHERGLSRLQAGADTLSFRYEKLPVEYAAIQARSVAVVGNGMLYFTDRGFYRYSDGKTEEVGGASVALIDLSQPIYAVSAGGNYYASVAMKSGERLLYCYDGFANGRFIGLENIWFTVRMGELYRLKDGKVDALVGRALPEAGGTFARFSASISDRGDGNCYLESIVLEGRGRYEVTASANGVTVKTQGRAGERLAFSGALRADCVTVTVTPLGEDFSLCGAVLWKRKEATYGN